MSIDDQEDQNDHNDRKSIVGALFFGVPNKGMDISSLIPMAGEQPNRPLLDSISIGSDLLQTQNQQFEKVFPYRDSGIISLYETMESPTAVHASLDDLGAIKAEAAPNIKLMCLPGWFEMVHVWPICCTR